MEVGTTKLFYCTILSGLYFFADGLQLGYHFEGLGTAGMLPSWVSQRKVQAT